MLIIQNAEAVPDSPCVAQTTMAALLWLQVAPSIYTLLTTITGTLREDLKLLYVARSAMFRALLDWCQ